MKLWADVLRNVGYLVCPSITTRRTCQHWARSEPVNMPKTIESPAKCGVRAVIRFIYFGTSDEEFCPQILSFFMAILGRILQLQQRGSWGVFVGKCLITHHLSRTWLSVIFIPFLVWNCRRRTIFWHNELQISVENWLKAQAAGFYYEGYWKVCTTL